MPLQATSGAASYDGFGGGVVAEPNYIESCFSTYLYTGNGSTQTITNGIDLSGQGGLVWVKMRSNGSDTGNVLFDTARGASQKLETNTAGASSNWTPYGVSAFGSTGFTVADDGAGNYITNNSGVNYASWTFRKTPKFFDVVTWSGNGTTQTLSHNLGSAPGFIIVKAVSGATAGSQAWWCYHQSMGASYAIRLNLTSASANMGAGVWGNNTTTVTPSATTFTIGADDGVNSPSNTYVAYLFAHNAGGFGLTGTDNVISCGSYTGNGSSTGPEVNIGYEPQWLLIKEATQSGNAWSLFDNMRGLSVAGPSGHLRPNASDAEDTTSVDVRPTATGFQPISSSGRVNRSGETFIYIAIRKGPMKVPTDATKVFAPIYSNPSTTNTPQTTGFPVDMQINRYTGAADDNYVVDRLRGVNTTATNNATPYLLTNSTAAEGSSISTSRQWTNTTFGSLSAIHIYWNFGRAPSFFDEVCYTGTGTPTNFSHNLAVVPELMIVKRRNASSIWAVYAAPLANAATSYLELTNDNAVATGNTNLWNSTAPTSTVFTIGSSSNINTNGSTNVAYLFATCAGVSKVGSYTGTGTTLQIDCGFTGGARFVLIKRTDSTGDWYVWDSARGIVSGNDPYLLLNSTAAEVTNTDYIDTYSAGFEISSTAPSAINASGGTFIFLAIA